MTYSALLLPSHGHAPYLLGVNLLLDLNVDICVPHYYGEDQRGILIEEFSKKTNADRIFLSPDLGLLFKDLLSDEDNASTFKKYSENVSSNFERISNDLKQIYEKIHKNSVFADSLSGKKKEFSQFDIALNTGLPVSSPIKPTAYAFVGKMSEIYHRAPKVTDQTRSLAEIWERVESSFTDWFIPRLNSLSYEEYDNTGVTETPPLESPTEKNEINFVSPNSILVVASGTDKGVRELKKLIASAPKKYRFIALPKSAKKLDLPDSKLSPEVWGNPNVIAVLARSGFGTIWKALVNKKPIGVIDPSREDDPEIYHNAQVVQKSGIGTILDDSINPLVEALPKYRSGIQNQLKIDLKIDKERFEQTDEIDGIKYTSKELKKIVSSIKTGGQNVC